MLISCFVIFRQFQIRFFVVIICSFMFLNSYLFVSYWKHVREYWLIALERKSWRVRPEIYSLGKPTLELFVSPMKYLHDTISAKVSLQRAHFWVNVQQFPPVGYSKSDIVLRIYPKLFGLLFIFRNFIRIFYSEFWIKSPNSNEYYYIFEFTKWIAHA